MVRRRLQQAGGVKSPFQKSRFQSERLNVWVFYLHFQVVLGVNVGKYTYLGLSPLPGCNRHHQDDITFLVGDPNLNLHLPQLLGGGTTQNIPYIEHLGMEMGTHLSLFRNGCRGKLLSTVVTRGKKYMKMRPRDV